MKNHFLISDNRRKFFRHLGAIGSIILASIIVTILLKFLLNSDPTKDLALWNLLAVLCVIFGVLILVGILGYFTYGLELRDSREEDEEL